LRVHPFLLINWRLDNPLLGRINLTLDQIRC
jgi:hypothetical protein